MKSPRIAQAKQVGTSATAGGENGRLVQRKLADTPRQTGEATHIAQLRRKGNDDVGLDGETGVVGVRALQKQVDQSSVGVAKQNEARQGEISLAPMGIGANGGFVQRHVRNSMVQKVNSDPCSTQASAPIQAVGIRGLLKWGGLTAATIGVGLMATGAAPILGAGLAIGGGISALSGAMGGRSPSKYKKRARSSTAASPNWYDERAKTAYSHTTGTGNQGPHTIPHIAKRVAAKNALALNPNFDPVAIPERTGLIPSAGQARALLREYEEETGSSIPLERKKSFDRHYRDALSRRDIGAHGNRVLATRDAMELNPLTTYSLEKVATHDEIKGKGERRSTVTPDLDLMSKMTKSGPIPEFKKVDFPSTPSHKPSRLKKFLRDMGRMYQGGDDQSELDLSSDDEY